MPNKTLSIALPDALREEINAAVDADYGNTSEFFRDAARELLKKRQEAKLERMLLEAVESDDFTPLTKQDFVEMKSELVEHIKSKHKESVK